MLAYKPFVVSAIPHQSSIRHTTILILIFSTCVRARMRASDRFTATAILEKPELNLELAFVWNRSKVTHHTHSNRRNRIPLPRWRRTSALDTFKYQFNLPPHFPCAFPFPFRVCCAQSKITDAGIDSKFVIDNLSEAASRYGARVVFAIAIASMVPHVVS